MKCSQENYIIPSNKIITSDSRNTFMISYFSHAKKATFDTVTHPYVQIGPNIRNLSRRSFRISQSRADEHYADQNPKGELLHEIRAND